MSPSNSNSRPRDEHWLSGGFLNLIHDLVDAKFLCWAEVAAATVSYYRGKRTYRLGVLSEVFKAVGQSWSRGPFGTLDQPGFYLNPLQTMKVQVDPLQAIQALNRQILETAMANRQVIILDREGEPGHCALVTGYVASRQEHLAVEIADPGGGKSLIPCDRLEIKGWQRFCLTHPKSNDGTKTRRRIDWSGIRESIQGGTFLDLQMPTEPIRQWVGGVKPVIGEADKNRVCRGAEPPETILRWVRLGPILCAIDEHSGAHGFSQWSKGPWLRYADSKIPAILAAGERIVAWVDGEGVRNRGWIIQAADGLARRFEKLDPPYGNVIRQWRPPRARRPPVALP